MRALRKRLRLLADAALSPFVFLAALLLGRIRRLGVHRLPRCKQSLLKAGVFPIRNHYYEPLFDARQLTHSLAEERALPGIDWNAAEQIRLLESLHFSDELGDWSGR